METPRLMDYHLHTAVTIDGKMGEIGACDRALSLGIKEIAFTNHVMLTQPDYTMSPASFLDHWEQIQSCKQRYPQINICLGIEMDYYLNREKEIEATLESYEKSIGRPFDLVLGSVHEIKGGFFSSKYVAPGFFKDRDLVSLYCDYFELAAKAVNSRLFDIIAHPDLIKKYTYELTPPVPFDNYRLSVEPFIDALINCGVGLEVNTKGLKLEVKEAYPSIEFLELYLSKAKAFGSEPIITLGSDAHKVDDVGFCIYEAAANLRKLGVRYLTSFENRNKSAMFL